MNTPPDTLDRLRKRTYGYTASRNDWDQRCPVILLWASLTPTGGIRLRESPVELPGIESFVLLHHVPDAMKFIIQSRLVDLSDVIALGLCCESYALSTSTPEEFHRLRAHDPRPLSKHRDAIEIFGTLMLTLDGHMMMFQKERPTGRTIEQSMSPGGGGAHALRHCVTILNEHLSTRA